MLEPLTTTTAGVVRRGSTPARSGEPSTASFHYFIANSYYKQGNLAEARREWEKAIELDVKGKFSRKARERLKLLK